MVKKLHFHLNERNCIKRLNRNKNRYGFDFLFDERVKNIFLLKYIKFQMFYIFLDYLRVLSNKGDH